MKSDLWKIPNLISAGRLLLLIPAGYFIAQTGRFSPLYALVFLFIAAVSDFLDGYLARRLNQQTELGKILDPLADKIMAATLVILLLLHRELPYWVAGVILGRDLIIMIGGISLKKKIGFVPPSNLFGKYCFTAIAVLLLSYVINFRFGISMFLIITMVLAALSLIAYTRSYIIVDKTGTLPQFSDKPVYKIGRITTTIILSVVFLYNLYLAFLVN